MNLKTEKGRRLAISEIEKSFVNELIANGVELAGNVRCSFKDKRVDLFFVKNGSRCGNISVYIKDVEFGWKKNEMQFVISYAFSPANNIPYLQTLQAASLLKNWKQVCNIVNDHCARYSNLRKKIVEFNQKK